ncbi:phospho-N-acetylmuramoyl-pentapeptide-transferase [Haloplasma contractile]|uniref:Phospho-N-acetylmuramoyl-pentapeptide-transferase n=1 Tax=Haloplasma contractile SSD-17B TaxID=1033810 RepID=F7PVI4_9MOLU|nr:phospho-N-acetylmuramoyl-pentapeptide-transferase [Haloplasma contractile]ERJ12848.1 Phospho-N-acetylmuramoyl-pentapeptide-transferase protein [Haloplasma contractile SSD-17B]
MGLRIIYFGIFASFILSVLTIPILLPILKRFNFGQSIREEGPKSHMVKSGTPTMGGIVFGFVTLVSVSLYFLLFNRGDVDFNLSIWLMLFLSLLGFTVIGFVDDYLIKVKKINDGLSPKSKLIFQILIASLFFLLYLHEGYPTVLKITSTFSIQLEWLYGILILLMLVGSSNAVNLTDGLDGLASGLATFSIGTFTFIAFMLEQYDVVLFGAALIGSILGFLVFNAHPAKIFMGDTGSLALGAALGTMAILTGYELLLILVGGVFVFETVTVMIQVTYFKLTKKFSKERQGKRIFKMTPIHHHFELCGLRESQVVLLFWSMGFVFSIIAIVIVLFELS